MPGPVNESVRMRGKVSFDLEEDESAFLDISTRKQSSSQPVRFSRPASKNLRGVAVTLAAREKECYSLDSVRDKDWVETTATEEGIGEPVPGEKDGEEAEGYDAVTVKKIEDARRIRAARKSDVLVADFVSLEETTQSCLDENDIAHIKRGSSFRSHKSSRPHWEDPEEEDEKGASTLKSSTRLESSDSESEREDKDHQHEEDELDQESFPAYQRLDGRIQMTLLEDDKSVPIDRIAMIEHDFDDEEDREWEMQQIQKGFSSGLKVSREARRASRAIQADSVLSDANNDKTPLPFTSLQTIYSQLNGHLKRSKIQMEELNAEISQVQLHMAECRKSIEGHEKTREESTEALNIYCSLERFINDFADMADELFPRLENLETEWEEALRSRQSRLMGLDEFDNCQQKLIVQKHAFFIDVGDEFTGPQGLLQRLWLWKAKFPESYEQCFVDLCIPSLVELFCRVEIIGFDPLAVQGNDTIRRLVDSIQDIHQEGISESAVNKIVSMHIIPRLTRMVAAAYDPLLTEQAEIICMIYHEMHAILPPHSRLVVDFKSIIEQCVLEVTISTPEEGVKLLKSSIMLAKSIDETFIEAAKRTVGAIAREPTFPIPDQVLRPLDLAGLEQLLSNF